MSHPAKFSKELIPTLASSLIGCRKVLDPFAGTGRIHTLNGYEIDMKLGSVRNQTHRTENVITLDLQIVAIELEREWVEHEPTVIGDCFQHMALIPDGHFDAVCTSPCYGNRMADHHEAKDASSRNTYRHTLGRPLSPGSAAALQWGPAYRDFHSQFLREAWRLLRPGGRLVLNIKNHKRGGKEMQVTEWFIEEAEQLGFVVGAHHKIPTPGHRQGANGDVRIDHESVIVFFKPVAIEDNISDSAWREHLG